MNVEIINSGKDELELFVDNQTVAELLRFYLNEQGVEFVAWRREHPTKPIILKVKVSSGTVNKAISDAVSSAKKDLSEISSVVLKKK